MKQTMSFLLMCIGSMIVIQMIPDMNFSKFFQVLVGFMAFTMGLHVGRED